MDDEILPHACGSKMLGKYFRQTLDKHVIIYKVY